MRVAHAWHTPRQGGPGGSFRSSAAVAIHYPRQHALLAALIKGFDAVACRVMAGAHQVALDILEHCPRRQQPLQPGTLEPAALERDYLPLAVALVLDAAAVGQTDAL